MKVYNSINIRPGDVILDVGANIGDFTVLSSWLTGPQGSVIAIEPNPFYYEILNRNIALNGLRNVKPLRLAVSNKEERLSISNDDLLSHHLRTSRFEAFATTIDKILNIGN